MSLSIDVGAGELDQRWTLQIQNRARTSTGGVSLTWTDSRKVWCKISPSSGSQSQEHGAREPQITHEIIARLEGGDIGPEKRLRKGIRVMMIVGRPAIIDEARDLIKFNAIEGVGT